MNLLIPNREVVFRIMRISLCQFLMAVSFLHLSHAADGQAQEPLNKTISFSVREVALETVLSKLEKQSNTQFLYSREVIDSQRKVTFTARHEKLAKVLSQILTPLSLKYEVLGTQIIIRRDTRDTSRPFGEPEDPTVNPAQAPPIRVSGQVVDEKGEALPGVSIMVKGTQQGTTTNREGNFNFDVLDDQVTLVFSFVGYLAQEVAVGNRERMQITLKPDEKALEEVVVVGYGVQKKVNLTGAVDVITNEQIGNRQSSTVSQILQGQSPGLDFSVGAGGFEPGASMNLSIRGTGSLNGGGPFILIDGFPGEMDRLNPNDIESISILKDAAASAIYGARAPYGVILITTKSGKKNQKMSITYTGSVTRNSAQRLPKMLDSQIFAKVMNEMGDNGGGRPYSDAAIKRIVAYKNQDWDFLKSTVGDKFSYYEAMPLPNGRFGHNGDSHANYDWYKEYYGSSLNTQHNLALQGGSDKISYYLSGGMVRQNGILNYGVDTYSRYNLIGKVNASLTKWWDIKYESRLMKSPRERFNSINTNEDGYQLMFRQIMRTVPTQSKYDGFGNYSNQSKIPMIEDGGTDKWETTENWHTLATELRPLKGWKINLDFAHKSAGIDQSNVNTVVYEVMTDASKTEFAGSLPSGINQTMTTSTYSAANLFTSYELQLKKHQFSVLAGTQYELDKMHMLNATRSNLIVRDVPSLQTSNGAITASESMTHWATRGYFGRFNYNYDQKYLFEANARYDGTSKFLPGNRWGFFPSFSAGWNVDREKFWTVIEPVVNTFKVRASWGQLGNQQVRAYMDLALIPLKNEKLNWIFGHGNARPVGYTGTPSLVSPQLTWETATTKNLGFNLTFLKKRLQFDLDIYERTTRNMIGPSEPVPGVMGSSVPKANNATLRSKGFESILRWNDRIGTNGPRYSINFNISNVKTVVVDYLNPTGLITDWYEGKEVGEIWGYTANDLFKTREEVTDYLSKVNMSFINSSWNPGDVKYLDLNGDGRVNMGTRSLKDPGDLSIIGNSSPRYQYGLSGSLDWKGFDFSFLLKGTAKRDYFVADGEPNIRFWGVQAWLFTAMTPEHLDYFRDKPGTETSGLYEGDANINLNSYFPRQYLNSNQNSKNRQISSRYLINAAYWRIQNLQLGYSLPSKLLDKLKIQKMRLYVSGENLFTNTKLLRGMDPVAITGWGNGVGNTYGADRMLSFGISSTF
jgi:TonB-linked SusC/RagA family outer membrane protein